MAVNEKGLRETLAYIEDRSWQHNQNSWGHKNSCGTTACFAGWHLILTDQAEWIEGDSPNGCFYLVSANDTSVYDAAVKSLGLNEQQARALFFESQNLSDVRSVVDQILEGKAEPHAVHWYDSPYAEFEDDDHND